MKEISATGFRSARVAELRHARGLSRGDLAVLAGVSPETVRAAELGLRVPRARVIRALADGLGTTVDDLCPPTGPVTLAVLRRRLGLTLRGMGERVGATGHMVSMVEAGVYGVSDRKRWARGYSVSQKAWAAAWTAGREARIARITTRGEDGCPSTSEPPSPQ